MKCQPFGSRVSPRNWGRVVTLVQRLARALLNLILFCYVDDLFAAEPKETVQSAYDSVKALTEILGLNLSEEKSTRPSSKIDLLGARISIHNSSVVIQQPKEKRDRIKSEIKEHLKSKTLSSGAAATLRGKLGFTQQLCQGRFGKIMT